MIFLSFYRHSWNLFSLPTASDTDTDSFPFYPHSHLPISPQPRTPHFPSRYWAPTTPPLTPPPFNHPSPPSIVAISSFSTHTHLHCYHCQSIAKSPLLFKATPRITRVVGRIASWLEWRGSFGGISTVGRGGWSIMWLRSGKGRGCFVGDKRFVAINGG